ncbi:MAG: cytochrome C oxidase subunit IV family protein, partial [candidate division Zixibacteria bacterium]|nr:cytochrome C oxidase subunit IV family protein [candidate division Zixibacteria bacterium]
VAAVKATLVLLFFMHLKYDNKLYAFAFLISIAFLAVFITFTLLDTLYRDQFGRGSIDKQVPYKSAPAHPGGESTGTAGSSVPHSADSTTATSHK